MAKTAAVVVLYNPDLQVKKNVLTYTKAVEKLFIIDNSPVSSKEIRLNLFPNGEFLHFPKNIGIASALNIACEKAVSQNVDYLLTMDQDSSFEEKEISKYLECVTNFENKTRVALFGVNYKQEAKNKDCVFTKTNLLITSGSIINLSVYKEVGAFDENLFIDLVDTDYCLRSVQKGFDIIEFSNVHMVHNLGVQSVHRSVKNLKPSNRSIHSSVRLYYMTRNYFYLKAKYRNNFKPELNSFKKDLIIRIKNNLLYQKGRLHAIALIIKGWRDYKKNKMGKISV